MPLWQGKSRGTPIGYRIFVAILKNFGVAPAYLLLRFVSFYYFLVSHKSSRAIFSLYREKMGFGFLDSIARLYRNYYLFGQTIIDKVVVMAGISNSFSFQFDGEENLHQMVSMQRGGLLLSAHIGNWEIAGHLLRRLQTKINIVMYDGEDKQIKRYLDTVTGERGVQIILIKNDLSHIYEISQAFERNELVCMHADRYMEGNKTIAVSILGEQALLPMGPFLLATTFKVPVSFVFAMKETSRHYHFFASKAVQYEGGRKAASIERVAGDFAAAMEEKVKQYPEQWYNYYNFWHK